MDTTCYDNTIGLSAEECECLDNDGRPVDYNVSRSGLYLDQLAPLKTLDGFNSCDGDVWSMATTAVTEATLQFVKDVDAMLVGRYTIKRKPVSSKVMGEVKARDVQSVAKNYAVVRIACCPTRSGLMRIKKIGGVFADSGNVDVTVTDAFGTVYGTYTVPVVANKHIAVDVGLDLPLYSKYAKITEYFLHYQYDPLVRPKETTMLCGCGGWEGVFDMDNPYFNHLGTRKGGGGWADYVMVGGLEVNSVTELEEPDLPTVSSNKMYGLTVEADFSCKASEVLCKDALDFVANPLALSVAFAIRYKAAAILADKVLKSTLIDRDVMVAGDIWEQDREEWTELYDSHVLHIVQNVDITANDCLTCRSVLAMTREGIFA